ncbi:MAG: NAD(P)/FAD-dependent oxidoreductase [Barnesiella sp.]|nr:NAD(P)/FAD-dependent oxidoreductase [Barnesiella sp.]MBD5247744.1 NAD(P)/FAD-dependent oxidoreductase [Barnesiella sp.]
MAKQRLVIIGAGFGGLNIIKNIDKKKWDVTIIDRHNYHSFPPLFYQVASSGLEPASIAFSLRREMRRRRVRPCSFHMGNVKVIDVKNKTVSTGHETIPYDSLVIAAGTTNNFFGMDDLRDRVFTLKSTPEAIRTRNRIIDRLERASTTADPDERRRMLTFVVVGGGPTGVEIAGAIGEVKRYAVPREYPELKQSEVTVKLIEGTDRLLRTMTEKSSADAASQLSNLMVDIELGKTMKSYENGVLTFSDGSTLEADTVIWTAGVTGEPFKIEGADVKYAPGNRFVVDEYNRVEGLDDVYAVGDISCHVSEEYPRGCPQLAQPAIQQGRNLARNLNKGTFERPFKYKDKGSMATVGRNRAVVDIGKVHFSGYFAWLTWMVVHLMTLLGMRNKVIVFINWIWNYWTYSSALRILVRPSRYPLYDTDPMEAPNRHTSSTKQ